MGLFKKILMLMIFGISVVLFQNCSQWKGNVEIAPSQLEKISGDTAKEIIGDIGTDVGNVTTGTGADISGGDDANIVTSATGSATTGNTADNNSNGGTGDSTDSTLDSISNIDTTNGNVSDGDIGRICNGYKKAQAQSVASIGDGAVKVLKFNGFDVIDVESMDVGYLIAKDSGNGGDRNIILGDINKLNEEGVKYTQQGNVLVFIANSDVNAFREIQYIARNTQMKLYFCNFKFRVGHNISNGGSIAFYNDFQDRSDENFDDAYMTAFYNKDGLSFDILTLDSDGNFLKISKTTKLNFLEKALGLEGKWYKFKQGGAYINLWAAFYDLLNLNLRSFLKL